MGEELFDENLSATLILEPEIPEDLPITFVDADLMKKSRDIRHEGDGMLSEAGEDVDERIDEIWTAEEEVVETYAVDARAGVVTHSYFVMFVHWMHGEVPSWKMRIHLVVGDVDGVSFIIKLLHLLENALFEDGIALESWDH